MENNNNVVYGGLHNDQPIIPRNGDRKLKTGFLWSEYFMWHNTGYAVDSLIVDPTKYLQPLEHVENPESKRRFKNLLDTTGLMDVMLPIKPRQATDIDVLRFHTKEYIKRIKEESSKMGGDGGDEAPFAKGGYEIATLAVGGCLETLDKIMKHEIKNAYALVRPPGHHAESYRGRGFCLLNNIALTSLYAMDVHNVKRIAIIDWDVHHGNGTQEAFWKDDRVLLLCVHQDNNYPPNSGSLSENGEGKGEGYNINIPLPPGCGYQAYKQTFERVIEPAVDLYKPELILVSCGFDAAAFDPLGRMMLHSDDFRDFTRRAMKLAEKHSNGKLMLFHEGGYSKAMVPFCGQAVIEELTEMNTKVTDPYVEYVNALGGREFLPHQEDIISKAEKLVEKLKNKISISKN